VTLRLGVIAGPTASGKTGLAVDVAHRLGSEIVSADSRQVYRGLDLGTGKDLDEYSRVTPPVRHHLIDVAPPAEVYTLYRFLRDCAEVLRDAARRPPFADGSVPLLLVGGTGLYVEAVVRGFRVDEAPPDPELRRRLEGLPLAELVERLERAAPDLAARTDLGRPRRVVRALEIAEGRRRGAGGRLPAPPPFEARVTVVDADREWLRRRIAVRLRERLEAGMVDEVRRLLAGGLPYERLESLGLEYREIGRYLAGAVTYAEMVARLEVRIGRFAKRQQTWFRGMERRGVPVTWIRPGDADAVLRATG